MAPGLTMGGPSTFLGVAETTLLDGEVALRRLEYPCCLDALAGLDCTLWLSNDRKRFRPRNRYQFVITVKKKPQNC